MTRTARRTRAQIDPNVRHFGVQVCELARRKGWLVHWSPRADDGFPHVVALRSTSDADRRLLAARLVAAGADTDRRALDWLAAFNRVGDGQGHRMTVHLWEPADWPVIEAILQ